MSSQESLILEREERLAYDKPVLTQVEMVKEFYGLALACDGKLL